MSEKEILVTKTLNSAPGGNIFKALVGLSHKLFRSSGVVIFEKRQRRDWIQFALFQHQAFIIKDQRSG